MNLQSDIIIDIAKMNSKEDINIDSILVDINILENKKEFKNLLVLSIQTLYKTSNLKIALKAMKSLIILYGISGIIKGLEIINKILQYTNVDKEMILDWINFKCFFWFVGYRNEKLPNRETYNNIITLLPEDYNFEKFKLNFEKLIIENIINEDKITAGVI